MSQASVNEKLRARARASDLNDRRRAIDAEQEAIEQKAIAENGGKFTDASRAAYDKLTEEHRTIVKELEELSPLLVGRVTESGPWEPTSSQKGNSMLHTLQNDPLASRRSSNLFPRESLSTHGYCSVEQFLKEVGSGRYSERLASLSQGEYSDPYGGFAVPTQFSAELMDISLENEIVRPRARVVPMTTKELETPRWDGQDHTTGVLYGGLRGYWGMETQTVAESNAAMELMTLTAHRLMLLLTATNELLADAPGFQQPLNAAIGSSLGWQLDDAFLNGTGVGQPLGILHDPAAITISKEVGQAANTINYENLKKMFSRMHDAGRSRAVWIANSSAIPALLSLVQTVGTGGDTIPVMTEGPDGFKILTRPVLFTEKLPAIGTKGDIVFADLSQYVVGLRQEMRIDYSPFSKFESNQILFRAMARVDGRGSWKTVLTPKNGPTQSWVVTLETRS
ncbi:phage major capsid protein [Planctomicrobium sp. SH664]|uniref:phage major capsid protein n=1 Tax=Planctomicrobium sp. SH664 TaxID=3448125 RepID=UPI003F5B197B